jgi:AraC-like DNA-binding protein
MAFVRAVLLGIVRRGGDASSALEAARIAPSEVARPGALVTARQFERLSEAAMRALDDEALGWFERRLPWGSLGMLCRASLPSPDLGVALRRWCRHHRLLVDEVALSLTVAGGRATLAVEELADLGALREFCLVSLLRYVHGFACWAVDSRLPLLEAGFPFERPPHGAVYPLLFPGPIGFQAGPAHLTFDAADLALPLRRDDAALRTMLRHALPLTVLQYRRDRHLVQRVRRLLAEDPAGRHDAPSVARRLHLSVRSLHRHLAEEGASLQGLKDEGRRARATALLARSDLPVKAVARAVGFRDAKSFSRAFRGWTGAPPMTVRRGGR